MDPVELNAARQEELKRTDKLGMSEEVPDEERWVQIGEPPIGLRWVDVAKNSDAESSIRSQVCSALGGVLDVGRQELVLLLGLHHCTQGVFGARMPLGVDRSLLLVDLDCLAGDAVRNIHTRLEAPFGG